MKKTIVIIMGFIMGCNSFCQTNPNRKLEESINNVFERFANYNRFNGSVLISQNDKIIYKKSFGYADVQNLKKNTKNSIFSIASVTKPLTAVGIMKLVDQGKLHLETPISKYFPNFIPDFSKKITIRHLLNHSSGMQANVGRKDEQGNGQKPGKSPITLHELFEKFKDSKLKFEPGKGYEYNNFGYTLLAAIIEKVTNQSYADYMEQAVFKPANMKSTSVNSYNQIQKRALPYSGLGMKNLKKLTNRFHFSWFKGAGNINATSVDLYHFMNALENGVLLKSASIDKMYNFTQPIGVNNSEYGLGWRIEYIGGEKWINHNGLLPGTASIIGSLPEKNIKIIILSNATTTDLFSESNFQGKEQYVDNEIIDAIMTVLQGKNPELLPKVVNVNNKKTADFIKTFSLDNKHTLLLKKQDDAFTLETTGKVPWSIFTYKFSRNVKENNNTSKTALFFAKAMSTQKLKGLSKYANDEMKVFLSSEKGLNQLKNMWLHFIKNAGTFKSYNIYNIKKNKENKNVHIRFHFAKDDVGFVLGIDGKDQIQGMFIDDSIRTSVIKKTILTQVNSNEFFINGHQYNGMQDIRILIDEKEIILIDDKMQYKGIELSSMN